ncbi:MAG: class A beta-lactamase [Pseudomonadota bacterium]
MKHRHLALSRRHVISGLAALPVTAACQSKEFRAPNFAALETEFGGRLGVAALDLASGRALAHRADQRFAFCSSFKWLLGAFMLARMEAGEEDLERPITIKESDLVFYSPVTEPLVGSSLSIGELCEATITTSDNTAANLLISELGGPDGFTSLLRQYGDTVTRLDRYETELNENAPGDVRDTSSPNAMLGLMRTFLFEDALMPGSRDILRRWMIDAKTGLQRLRAGLPDGWVAGDKTGTSVNDQSNDVAFAFPVDSPLRGPVIIVSFANVPDPLEPETNSIHGQVARITMGAFGI